MIKKIILVVGLVLVCSVAWAQGTGFNKDVSYDIYYEVGGFEVDVVENVRILDLMSVEGITFLTIRGSGIADKDKKEGYILLENVRAILPYRAIVPKRTFDVQE